VVHGARGWNVVSCDVPAHRADELCGFLASDALGARIEPGSRGRARITIYTEPGPDAAHRVERVRRALAAAGIDPDAAAIRVGHVEDEHWVERFQASLRPRPLGSRFEVRAPGDPSAPSGRRVLWLAPGRAFGTGEHATTRLCAAALERRVRPGTAWLDLGCGTAVLALVARSLGADPVRGVDVDPEAIAVARDVLQANRARSTIDLVVGSLSECRERRWDGIVVNIETAFFTGDGRARELAAAVAFGGCLVASGFLVAECDEVAAALAAAGLETTESTTEGEWGALVAEAARP
jgi:ribosomal protein L11 methyltransferase